jgi:hypothetical protein
MAHECLPVASVTPSALGSEERLKIGSAWVHLHLCRTCGHVGCCASRRTVTPHKARALGVNGAQ